ncbi:GNAT family N-acetyltransferase [Streptosporangium canum]|uniref:GNAT family N-acetyltransferase n=1 Tax=Streptosporangium canum TaxID=324952 RepID=UPI00344089D5
MSSPETTSSGRGSALGLLSIQRRGVGRALMHAVLGYLRGPVTLTSATAGKPLYDSLGFDTVADATWWTGKM